ncbi:MAG: glycoside hydrolase family 3 C-terminal domain-containing protein [Ruminococcus sp.]|nr:glycoside hydrolase family 3 C-terminal domain-containing protein [Ruminococcus sp.]
MNNTILDKKYMKKAAEICSRLSLDDKITLICVVQKAIPGEELEDFIVGAEIARGFVGRKENQYSTVFPQPIGLAGTFDTQLMAEIGEIAGNESRAYYNYESTISPCMWGPTVDLERHPLWGRTEEGYGEDVCLTGAMSIAFTKAMAADNGEFVKTIPTLKHFAVSNNETDRDNCNADVPLRLKHEYYYAAFMYAVKYGGVKSIMTSYNEINGIPAMCHPDIDTVLKKDWGIWFTVTDGCDFSMNVTKHKYCETHAETLSASMKAGGDIVNDASSIIEEATKKALEQGLITMAELDHAVCNVIYARLKLGHFAENCPYNDISLDVLEDKKSAEINLKAAKEQIVLLKNNGILPFRNSNAKIAVLGAISDENFRDWYTGYFRNSVSAVEGMRNEFPESEIISDDLWDIVAIKNSEGKYFSVHRDGTVYADSDSPDENCLYRLKKWGDKCWNLYSEKHGKYIAYKDGTLKLTRNFIYDWFTAESFNFRNISGNDYVIEDFLLHRRIVCDGKGNLTFEKNIPVTPLDTFTLEAVSLGIERGKKLASQCDAVIYCAGNDPIQHVKECYDRTTLSLGQQEENVLAIHAVNPNTILAVISSFPYSITRSDEILPAIIYTTHAGPNLGTALAETISGRNIPAGRVALTWYRSDLDLPDIKEYNIENLGTTYMYFRGKPLYSFGYGLSYADFRYKSLEVSVNGDGTYTAYVTVENISDFDSDEVVQLYFAVEKSEVTRPIKKLCSFNRVHIKAHSEMRVKLEILPDILKIYDVRREKFITETAIYKFMAGGSSDNLPVSTEVEITGESVGIRKNTFAAYTFDKSNEIKTQWSKKLKTYYITTEEWAGTAVYCGVDFTGKSAIRLRISSILGDGKIYLNAGKNTYECEIKATASYDDFREYTIPVEPQESNYIAVTISSSMGIIDISII